jgi:hypothetical protein
MRPNLDSLTEEILQYLEAEHFIVFRSLSRMLVDDTRLVEWDTERNTDFRTFLECALKLGVRLVHFSTREFHSGYRDDAKAQLEESELPRERRREIERRFEEMALYEGFTCAIELTFDYENRIYCFELETEWFEEWNEMLDEIEDALPENEGPETGGYNLYSNN